MSAHTPTHGWGHILAGPEMVGMAYASPSRCGGRRGSHSGVAGAGPHPVFPYWHCSAERDTVTPYSDLGVTMTLNLKFWSLIKCFLAYVTLHFWDVSPPCSL